LKEKLGKLEYGFKELRGSGFSTFKIIWMTASTKIRQGLLRVVMFPNGLRRKRVKILDKDWKYLIIIDACRYDTFTKINHIDGKLSKIYSAGTETGGWFKNNFRGRKADDILYISGTPQVSDMMLKKRVGRNPFSKLINVWKWGWSQDLGTVHPEKVNKTVLMLKDKEQYKRMIIHYIQPHSPFIGEPHLGRIKWYEIKAGIRPIEEVKMAYEGNLKLVLKHVEELIGKLDGKIVITSDHGEMFGEYGVYSHHKGMYTRVLMEVPWLEIEK